MKKKWSINISIGPSLYEEMKEIIENEIIGEIDEEKKKKKNEKCYEKEIISNLAMKERNAIEIFTQWHIP